MFKYIFAIIYLKKYNNCFEVNNFWNTSLRMALLKLAINAIFNIILEKTFFFFFLHIFIYILCMYNSIY